tara:strand:- start:422 stop:679 length:258 start_codon:yes stop_codon:yes gene_type:complete
MSASISGTIKKQDGDSLAGVAVRLVHVPTGSVFAKTSNESGEYAFEGIRVGGPYTLSVLPEDGVAVEKDRMHLKTDESLNQDFVL